MDFTDQLPLVLAADAPSHGIGAVLLHRYADGSERPFAHASKTLNPQQLRYSQIEKEALSIIFGVQKFHQYIYGRTFELVTDNKPLLSIFNPSKQLPTMTAHRLQRWAITLMAYTYTIKYKPTKQHGNADGLSRLPAGPDVNFDVEEERCLEVTAELDREIKEFPVNAKLIAKETAKDAVLKKVSHFLDIGWPETLNKKEEDIKPFFARRFAITRYNGVLLEQSSMSRVIVPSSLRKRVLAMLHAGHWGIVRTKQLARRHCWWPGIDKEIQILVQSCETCLQNSSSPRQEFTSWPLPSKPWERIHVDFAGPFLNHMYLICVDAYSNFPYVIEMSSTTTEATVNALENVFAIEGLPELLVSDNGPQFASDKFQQFCNQRDVQHFRSAPFHPASNGEAERMVRTFKSAMKKLFQNGNDVRKTLIDFLISYRSLPNSTGKSPAELLHARQPRTLLSQLAPQETTLKTPITFESKFATGEDVYVRNFARGPRWIPAKTIAKVGRRMYEVQTSKGVSRRHQNQMRKTIGPSEFDEGSRLAAISQADSTKPDLPSTSCSTLKEPFIPRRSQRTRKPVVRFTSAATLRQRKR